MKHIKCKKISVIEEDNPHVFEERVNRVLEDLAKFKPMLEMNFNRPKLCGIIRYDYEEYIPENLSERFELEGIIYHCSDCPYAETYKNRDGSADKRREGHLHCTKSERQTLSGFVACDTFYRDCVVGKMRTSEDIIHTESEQLENNAIDFIKYSEV